MIYFCLQTRCNKKQKLAAAAALTFRLDSQCKQAQSAGTSVNMCWRFVVIISIYNELSLHKAAVFPRGAYLSSRTQAHTQYWSHTIICTHRFHSSLYDAWGVMSGCTFCSSALVSGLLANLNLFGNLIYKLLQQWFYSVSINLGLVARSSLLAPRWCFFFVCFLGYNQKSLSQ